MPHVRHRCLFSSKTTNITHMHCYWNLIKAANMVKVCASNRAQGGLLGGSFSKRTQVWRRIHMPSDLPFRPQSLHIAANTVDSISMFLTPALYALFRYSSFFSLEKEHKAPSNRPWPLKQRKENISILYFHVLRSQNECWQGTFCHQRMLSPGIPLLICQHTACTEKSLFYF